MTIAFHPFADIFELIEGPHFDDLTHDVKRHGVRERIKIFDDKILDGRNRYRAALAAGLLSEDDAPEDRPSFFERFVPAVDGDPLAFVISKNVHRRHLSIGQRAYAMAECERFRHGGDRRQVQDANLRVDRAETRAELAERGQVSERSITSAAVVRDHGVDELKRAVRRDEISVHRAEQIARLPEEEQRRHLPNGARAIMGSRIEPADSLDYFPTPPWATRALMQHVMPTLDLRPPYMPRGPIRLRSAWEPACGEGHIAEVLAEYADVMIATDIFAYGYGQAADFLAPDLHPGLTADWIITNPPFKERTEQFFQRAMERANVGVALFVRMQWLETNGRYERIYSKTPPTIIAFFAERVPLCKGEWNPNGDTATAYIWLVWVKGRTPQAPFWIPPGCRTDLEHDDDVTRFTTRPVMTERRIVEFCDGDFVDVASGEILNATPPVEEPPANEPRSTGNVAQPLSKSLPDDNLEIPVFLRRQPDNSFPVTVASPCLAEAVTGEGQP